MRTRSKNLLSVLVGVSLSFGFSGAAHAALQGRDLNGSIDSFEAYYDTDLNITWLADANYAKTSGYSSDGIMSWSDANTWAANLNIADTVNGITYEKWRLPTVNPINGTNFIYTLGYSGSTDQGYNITSPQSEMSHMFYNTLSNPGRYTSAGVMNSRPWLGNVGPFSNINLRSYVSWSSTEYAPSPSDTWWAFNFVEGLQGTSGSSGFYAWAVSDGDVGIPTAVPEASSWAMLLAGLGVVGLSARRRKACLVD